MSSAHTLTRATALALACSLGAAGLTATVVPASGQDLTPAEQAMKARKGHMGLYSFNLGILGAMAKGESEYDPAMAQQAADNIVALASLSQAAYWPPESDTESLEDSRALPALWENFPDAAEKGQAVALAADELSAVAGMDAAAIGPALGNVGKACAACHEAYQEPR